MCQFFLCCNTRNTHTKHVKTCKSVPTYIISLNHSLTHSLTHAHTHTVAVPYEILSKLMVHLHITFVNILTYDYSHIIMYMYSYHYSIAQREAVSWGREEGWSVLIGWVTKSKESDLLRGENLLCGFHRLTTYELWILAILAIAS